MFGVSSMTVVDPDLITRLSPSNKRLEIACNQFAAEVLVPDAALPWEAFRESSLDAFLDSMSQQFNVSREVILRKLRDRNLVTREQYMQRAATWASEPARADAGETGGYYYATQSTYLSKAFVNLAFSQFRSGRITLPEMSEHLHMKARSIEKFEDYLLARG